MKINEVVTEAGFFKGVARAIAPQTVQTYDRQKNALRAPAVDQDAIRKFAKYNKFVDILASRAKAGQAQSLQTIGQQLPKKGETANPDVRRQVLIYVAQKLQSRGIQVQGFTAPTPQPSIKAGNEIIQPAAIATPAPTTSAPTQPTAQASQDATTAALAARRAAGLSAYESLDYATFKQRLHEAKTQ